MTGTEPAVVVGGGVIGLTTAVLLAEAGRPVRVWSREPAAETVSAVAGGLCWPYRVEPVATATAWAVDSLATFRALAADPEATGVRMRDGIMASGGWLPPEWAAATGARPLAPDESPAGASEAVRVRTPLIAMPRYLAYLHRRLTAAGGRWERRTVTALEEAGQAVGAAGTVFNCVGLGARELVPDPEMRPVQGQLVIVADPGVRDWYVGGAPTDGAGGGEGTADDGSDSTYLLPQPYGLVLGGTAREGTESTVPDPAVARAIVERCARVEPRVARAEVLAHRVGLRPGRSRVRLASENLPGGARCVHHYGHGGAGVTVSWAAAAAAIAAADGAAPVAGGG